MHGKRPTRVADWAVQVWARYVGATTGIRAWKTLRVKINL
jgi:hypothetical protein